MSNEIPVESIFLNDGVPIPLPLPESVFGDIPKHLSEEAYNAVVEQYPTIRDTVPNYESLKDISVHELLARICAKLDPEEKFGQLELLKNIFSQEIKIYCVKEVYSVHTGVLVDDITGKKSKIGAFGVNGFNPTLLGDEQYPVSYISQQIQALALLQGIEVTDDKLQVEIKKMLGAKKSKTHLSCDEITKIMKAFDMTIDGKLYCLKDQNVPGGVKQMNTACPSHLYCAEGSAQLGLRYAALLAHLFDLDELTVTRVARFEDDKVLIHASPVSADKCKKGKVPEWKIWLPRLHDYDPEKIAHLFYKKYVLPEKVQSENLVIDMRTLEDASWGIDPGGNYKGVLQGHIPLRSTPYKTREAPAILRVMDHTWTANVCPCPICATKGKDRVATPGFKSIEVDDVSAIYFTRFSQEKYNEGIDAGDIIPLLILYAKYRIIPRRIMDDLSRPSMRKK
jgi:hypothetical protein